MLVKVSSLWIVILVWLVAVAAASFPGQGRSLGGSAQLVVTDMGYRFAGNRTRPSFVAVASVNASLYQGGRQVFYTPNYDQTDVVVCIANFWTPQVAAAPFEVRGDPGRQIEGVSLKIGAVVSNFTFNGSTTHTFGTEPYVCSDQNSGIALPGASQAIVTYADYTPLGLRRPLAFNPIQAKYGDGGTQGATTQSAYLAGGAMPTPAFGLLTIAPFMIVAKGAPAGQPVGLVVGDSLASGGNQNIANQTGSRANLGYIPIGLDDDTAGVGRIAFGMFAVGSTNFYSLTADQFFIRRQMLAELGNPFNFILCNDGQNNVGGGYPSLKGAADTGWAFLKTFLHGTTAIKLIQTTINPLSQDVTTNKWSLVAPQTTTAANTYPNGERYLYNSYVKTTPSPVDAYIDITPYWVDATLQDRWKYLGRNSVLAADATTGNTSISVAGTPPLVGDGIIIGAGATGAFYKNVGAVTGTGPYTVTFTVGQGTVSGTYLAGATVRATPSDDGIHAQGPLHVDAANGIIAAKESGVFQINFLLARDLDPANDNCPAWLEKAA